MIQGNVNILSQFTRLYLVIKRYIYPEKLKNGLMAMTKSSIKSKIEQIVAMRHGRLLGRTRSDRCPGCRRWWTEAFAVMVLVALGLTFVPDLHAQQRKDIRVTTPKDLRFGRLVNMGGGEARIDARSGNRVLKGGLSALGKGFGRARIVVRGERGRVYTVTIPRRALLRSGEPGAEGVIVKRFELDQSPSGVIGKNGKVTINVGATLVVGSSQSTGNYNVSVPVIVEYQ